MKKFLLALPIMLMTMPAYSGPFVQGDTGITLQTSSYDNRDNSYTVGVSAGYDFGIVSTAIVYNKTPGTSGNVVDSDLFLGEVTVSPFTISRVTPFAGAGVGLGYFSGNGIRTNNGRQDTRIAPVFDALVGVKYNIDNNWSLVGTGKYITTAETVTYDSNGRSDVYSTFQVTAGIRYNF